ncbi:MAG TPA: hypothetical protein VHM70_26400 [Polyangiaceae bacterium]|nr:hypothetical protein [Polyangiaceae bacterium]
MTVITLPPMMHGQYGPSASINDALSPGFLRALAEAGYQITPLNDAGAPSVPAVASPKPAPVPQARAAKTTPPTPAPRVAPSKAAAAQAPAKARRKLSLGEQLAEEIWNGLFADRAVELEALFEQELDQEIRAAKIESEVSLGMSVSRIQTPLSAEALTLFRREHPNNQIIYPFKESTPMNTNTQSLTPKRLAELGRIAAQAQPSAQRTEARRILGEHYGDYKPAKVTPSAAPAAVAAPAKPVRKVITQESRDLAAKMGLEIDEETGETYKSSGGRTASVTRHGNSVRFGTKGSR